MVTEDARTVDYRPWRGQVDLVSGGPPCQPFSSGGKRLGATDPRDGLPTLLATVRVVRPRCVLIENVAGLAAGSRRAYFVWLIAELQQYGYVVSSWVLDAADYGVPQHRRRLFIVGLERESVLPPAQTSAHVSVRDALADVDPGPTNASPVIYAKRPHLRRSPYTGLLFNGSGRPINPDAPAPTVLAIAGGNKTHFLDREGYAIRYHRHLLRGGAPRVGRVPGANRLTVQQSAVLQAFPPGTRWGGTLNSQYRQIGNAVPPPLAQAVAESVMSSRRGRNGQQAA